MDRRGFITVTGAAVLTAGCVGDESDGSDTGNGDPNGDAETGDDTPEESTNGAEDNEMDDSSDDGSGDENTTPDGSEDEISTPTDSEERTSTPSGESGNGAESNIEPPSETTDPEELLPAAENGWEQTETGPQPEGEAGVYAVYEKEGREGYQVAVIRWGSRDKAVEEKETFEGYTAITYVVLGKFSFISYDNGSGQDPYGLLGQSPALTAEYAKNNDLIS